MGVEDTVVPLLLDEQRQVGKYLVDEHENDFVVQRAALEFRVARHVSEFLVTLVQAPCPRLHPCFQARVRLH